MFYVITPEVLPPCWGHLVGIACKLHGMHRCKDHIANNALARDLFSVHVTALCVSDVSDTQTGWTEH